MSCFYRFCKPWIQWQSVKLFGPHKRISSRAQYVTLQFIFFSHSSFPGSSERYAFSQGYSSLLVDPLDLTAAPHPRFPVQGHILSAGGDALREPLPHPRETRDSATLPAPNTHCTSKLPNFQEFIIIIFKNIYKQMGSTFHSIEKNCFALYLVKLPFQSNQCLCAIGVVACPQSSTHVLSRDLMQLRLRFAQSALHWFSNHSQPYMPFPQLNPGQFIPILLSFPLVTTHHHQQPHRTPAEEHIMFLSWPIYLCLQNPSFVSLLYHMPESSHRAHPSSCNNTTEFEGPLRRQTIGTSLVTPAWTNTIVKVMKAIVSLYNNCPPN